MTTYLEVHSIIHTVVAVSLGGDEARGIPEGIAKITVWTSRGSRKLTVVALDVLAKATVNGEKMRVPPMTSDEYYCS